MSVREILEQIPKLSDEERGLVLRKLVSFDEGFEPTPAMEEAIQEGLRSLRQERTFSAAEVRSRIAAWTARHLRSPSMRLLIELIVAAALIALSWNKSFKQWASETPGLGHYFTAQTQTPKPKSSVGPTSTATAPPKEFTGHIYYTDEQGKKYWLDAQGRRHYEP